MSKACSFSKKLFSFSFVCPKENETKEKGTPSKAFLLNSYPQLPISCFPDLFDLEAATEITRPMHPREILPIASEYFSI